MPSSQKRSYGSIVQARVRRVLKGILEATKAGESSDSKKLQFRWKEEAAGRQKLTIETTLQTLMHVTNQDGEASVTTANVREALEAMRDFLGMLQDHRVKTKGEAQWNFTLTLSSTHVDRNLEAFDELWESKRSPKAKLQAVLETPLKLGLKTGAPYPKVRLPDNFVPRVQAFDAVKGKLLAETDRPLVVSAIAGLGGLGKSVLATALVLDAQVQRRFEDGILWVTLGQNPDLQNLLGDWIRTLDKSRESYSATTLEAASNYLHTLLLDKRMLLVVDDVWNGAHVELFRIGGAQCRVLMTTREAQIEGADYHALSLMTEAEAIALVRQKLDRQWQPEQEPEVKAFTKSLGYLPLALDLATNQVRDGLSWAELRSEFETERRSVALEVLDSSEAWDCLDENQQRKYSLRACFNLSLRRLSAEQLRQFAWLGVLPEDVSLDARMAVTLWELSPLKAKKTLIDLRNRSFLTSGTETLEGEVTYRVHDLMHDTARGLIEQATLSASIQTLADAHAQLLDRYRQKCDRWDRLPNDGYIHRHLTWHLQQAGREDEIHALMAMSDEQGRNAWFEACDRLGQPAIFMQDVKRGWSIAEQSYEEDHCRSIVLQCRYALITATLNSLVENLPIGMMAEFIKRQYWTVEQAWAYVEQMQDERKVAEAIEELAPYLLSKSIFGLAVDKTHLIQSLIYRAQAMTALAKINSIYFSEALVAAQLTPNGDHRRSRLLLTLAEIDNAYLTEVLDEALSVEDESERAWMLIALAQINKTHASDVLGAAQTMQDELECAKVLIVLAQIDAAYFPEASAAVQLIQNEFERVWALNALIQFNGADFAQLLDLALSIQDESCRVWALYNLAQCDQANLSHLLDAAQSIQNEEFRERVLDDLVRVHNVSHSIQDKFERARALHSLFQSDQARLAKLFGEAQLIQNEFERAKALVILAQIDFTYFSEALAVAQLIEDESEWAEILILLAKIDNADFAQLMNSAQLIQNKFNREKVLNAIAQIEGANFANLLDTTWTIGDKSEQARVLVNLAKIDNAYFQEALSMARSIQDNSNRAGVWSALVQIDSAYFQEALTEVQAIPDESERATKLIGLAQIANADFEQLLNAAQSIHTSSERARALIALAQIKNTYSPDTLVAVSSVQDEGKRAWMFMILSQLSNADFGQLLNAASSIQDDSERSWVLRSLAEMKGADFEQLLNAASSLQDESKRSSVLSSLAKMKGADFEQLLNAARLIQGYVNRFVSRIKISNLNDRQIQSQIDLKLASNRELALSTFLRCCAWQDKRL